MDNEQYQIDALISELGTLNEAEVEVSMGLERNGYSCIFILKHLVKRREAFNAFRTMDMPEFVLAFHAACERRS